MQFNELYFYTINDDYLLKIERFRESVENGYYNMNQFLTAIKQIQAAKKKVEDYLYSVDSFQDVEFSGDLVYLNLKGIDFRGATFKGSKDSPMKISVCNMENVNFSNVNFNNVELSGVPLDTLFYKNLTDIYGVDIPKVVKTRPFKYTICKNSNFSGASFKHCNVSSSAFQDCSFAEVGKKTCQFNESIFNNSVLLKDVFTNMYSYKMPEFNRCFINDITIRDSIFSDKYKNELQIYNKKMFDKNCMIYSLNWIRFPLLDTLSKFQKLTAKLSPQQGESIRNAISLLPLSNENRINRDDVINQVAEFYYLPSKYINLAINLTKVLFEKTESTHIVNIQNAEKYVDCLFKCLESSRQTYYNKLKEEKSKPNNNAAKVSNAAKVKPTRRRR